MKSSHYPSLELCRKLTEIGFPKTQLKQAKYGTENDFDYVCPSVMEMLDVMPSTICNWYDYHMEMQKTRNGAYAFTYRCSWPDEDIIKCWTLPNALAEMCLYLHENWFVSFKKTI